MANIINICGLLAVRSVCAEKIAHSSGSVNKETKKKQATQHSLLIPANQNTWKSGGFVNLDALGMCVQN